jgi:hypothetical protein
MQQVAWQRQNFMQIPQQQKLRSTQQLQTASRMTCRRQQQAAAHQQLSQGLRMTRM